MKQLSETDFLFSLRSWKSTNTKASERAGFPWDNRVHAGKTRIHSHSATDKSTRYVTHTTKRSRKFLRSRSKHFAAPDNTCVPNRIMRGGESKTYTAVATDIYSLFILIFVGWPALICHVLIAGVNFVNKFVYFEAFDSFMKFFFNFLCILIFFLRFKYFLFDILQIKNE